MFIYLKTGTENLLYNANESKFEISVSHCIYHRVQCRVEVTWGKVLKSVEHRKTAPT